MASIISSIKDLKPDKSYQGSIPVKVVAVGQQVAYTKNGQNKTFLPLAIANTTAIIML